MEGVIKAAKLGYKNIAVTVNANMGDDLSKIRKIEKDHNISVTSLVICTTGISKKRIDEINEYADIVWSCASQGIRKNTGARAILQLSAAIPVFVLTKKGLDLAAGYCSNEQLIRGLDINKQFYVSGAGKGIKIRMGNFNSFLREEKLPVRSHKEPR